MRSIMLSTLFVACNAYTTARQQSSLTWGPCEYEAVAGSPNPQSIDCAKLEVPLDYTGNNPERIQLHLTRSRAANGQTKGSVLFNPGGPGASGFDSVVPVEAYLRNMTRGDHDIITFDPRGTGKTIPFNCLSYNKTSPLPTDKVALADARGPIPELDMKDLLVKRGWEPSGDWADACYADNKRYGAYLSTAFVARDMLEIVNALEEDGMLRYYGLSYGTFLGRAFAAMFPDKVDRMVLDANVDLDDYISGIWPEAMLDADKSFDNFLNACLASPSLCSIANATGSSTTAQSLKVALGEVLAELYQSQQAVAFGLGALYFQAGLVPTTLYEVIKRQILVSLYGPGSFLELADTLAHVLARNFTIFDPPEEALAAPAVPIEPYNEGPASFWGIACSDSKVRATRPEDIFALVEQEQKSSSLADSYLPQLWSCCRWRFEPAERFNGTVTKATKNPILFINGPFDPVTPMVAAEKANAKFANSVLLRHNGHGHGFLSHPSACVMRAVQAYYADGTLPDPRITCEPDLPAFEYAAERARAKIAKAGANSTAPTAPQTVTESGSEKVAARDVLLLVTVVALVSVQMML